MKMKIFNNKLLYILVGFAFVFYGCTEDDATGDSSLSPTNPTVQLVMPATADLAYGDDVTYTVGVSLSEPQVVDVVVNVVTGGDAVEGEDYSLSAHSVTIPAYRTDGGTIDVTLTGLSQRVEAETLTLTVGDARTANASITPATLSIGLGATPGCVLMPDLGLTVGDFSELNDDGNPQTSDVAFAQTDGGAAGEVTITNFAFSSDWWCAQPDATVDIVIDPADLSVKFPEGGDGTTQRVGNLPSICGNDGGSVTLVGDGTWDPCTGVISFTVEVTVDAGSFGETILTYTPK